MTDDKIENWVALNLWADHKLTESNHSKLYQQLNLKQHKDSSAVQVFNAARNNSSQALLKTLCGFSPQHRSERWHDKLKYILTLSMSLQLLYWGVLGGVLETLHYEILSLGTDDAPLTSWFIKHGAVLFGLHAIGVIAAVIVLWRRHQQFDHKNILAVTNQLNDSDNANIDSELGRALMQAALKNDLATQQSSQKRIVLTIKVVTVLLITAIIIATYLPLFQIGAIV